MTKKEAYDIIRWAWNVDEIEAEDRDNLFRIVAHALIDSAQPYEIEAVTDFLTDTDTDDGDKVLTPEAEAKTTYPTEPCVMYTGGGFWVCAAWISQDRYVAISNEDECPGLTVYDSTQDDDPDVEFGFMCMTEFIGLEDCSEEQTELYVKMYKALKDEMN